MSNAKYRDASVGGCVSATAEHRPDGSLVLRSTEPLRWFPDRLTDALEQWAAEAPDRTLVARRGPDGQWIRISYAQMLQRAQAVGQALLDLGLSVDRPLAILSENDLEHFTLAMGAMWAGVPYAPVSSAYSLVSQDYGKLRHILGVVTPGLVFASDARFAKAIATVLPADVPVALTDGAAEAAADGPLAGRRVLGFNALLAAEPGAALAAAHAAVGPDTIAKFLFTSGSTKAPKGVVNTQRMVCANQQQVRQCMAFLAEEPPVLVDWLPWNHTFGGNHNIGITVYNGGTLYIDDGKPTPKGIAETLRNLREIAPTVYFNVPKGFEEIASAMDTDTVLRDSLFKRCKAFMFAGAGLAQAVWDKLDAHGEAAVGERLRMVTGLGMTETAPACMFAVGTDTRSGHIGLPVPGVEVKLVKDDSTGGKLEIRFKGPNVMPGYWRAPEQTADAFDDEGFYRTGDAGRLIDPDDIQKGVFFDGRTAEDFKLSTGTFVSVGPLRAKIIAAGDPLVQDAVITGINRDDVGAMLFPRPDECRKLAGLGDDVPLPEVLHHPVVRSRFQQLADRLWRDATGSASRVARLHVLAEPPSIDKGEVTDKGSINQRAVLQHRDALVQALYEGTAADPFLILPNKG
ncbi:feruloyl-CoA synthase [Pseudaquabacterium pictum]|uniref:Feruloyl-CoA synthase n=1 Tax=Pseudaquabacterium pictum TaxID=2315236 RepID=A0A480AP42_9BURK|nr:feruloyl-CoA synthase [Rubrivivax pictus]GCL63183.1 feruloyl-CoA synthase [Rubrivivax pictus]